jgi:hypothetical protein
MAQQMIYYFYTGKEPGGSYEPFTMYHDTDDSTDLSTSDTPIRFDFKVSNQGEYTLYSDGATGSFQIIVAFKRFRFIPKV